MGIGLVVDGMCPPASRLGARGAGRCRVRRCRRGFFRSGKSRQRTVTGCLVRTGLDYRSWPVKYKRVFIFVKRRRPETGLDLQLVIGLFANYDSVLGFVHMRTYVEGLISA